MANPIRTINSVAPIRICDNGGWTDTWFAKHGKIFNIGVYPYSEVQLDVFHRKSHSSSDVHERVIRELEDAGPDNSKLEALRITAEKSRDAVFANDFGALGQAMSDNTYAQANLNPYLISNDAQRIIDIAKSHGAIGWKVNGAGGEGGSLTLLCNEHSSAKRTLISEIESDNDLFKHIPTYLSRFGLRIWEITPKQ